MLKNIPSLIPPILLKIMCELGHGDEIVLADGNFPSERLGRKVVRLDGHGTCEILKAIISLFPLDTYAKENAVLMKVVETDKTETPIWDEYDRILRQAEGDNLKKGFEERFAFYERAEKAYAVIATGEKALYANLILKKGVL